VLVDDQLVEAQNERLVVIRSAQPSGPSLRSG
jgi:hypothetical protein